VVLGPLVATVMPLVYYINKAAETRVVLQLVARCVETGFEANIC